MANENILRTYNPDIAIPPGETLKDILESKSMSQTELATRMNRPIKTISEIVNGKAEITPETAYQLQQVLDVPAGFWLNLEKNYQVTKEKIEFAKHLKHQASMVKRFPYAEMASLEWVKRTKDKVERASNLLTFFGVIGLERIQYVQSAAFRKSQGSNLSAESLCAWLRRGELKAQEISAEDYDKDCFKRTLADIRESTSEINKNTLEYIANTCAKCGVAVVFVPHLKKTYVNGAARWLGKKKALIQMSFRYKSEDIFWFSFFHEAGHILLHGKKDRFIDLEKESSDELQEVEANNFARDFLIPPSEFAGFVRQSGGSFSEKEITKFAKKTKISPGIVVGRLQHEGLIGFNKFNYLRKNLAWLQ